MAKWIGVGDVGGGCRPPTTADRVMGWLVVALVVAAILFAFVL